MDLLKLISSANLHEYGVYPDLMSDKIQNFQNADSVIVALNNIDIDSTALSVLESTPAKVFEGMKLLSQLTGSKNLVLMIPNYAKEIGASVESLAKDSGISVQYGIVNKRATANSLVTHILTCLDIVDIQNQSYVDGVYVSVNHGKLKKIPANTIVNTLVEGEIKGIQVGYRLFGLDSLDKTIGELNPENTTVRTFSPSDCIVDFVDRYLTACRVQSCGKCVFCREGLLQLEAMQKDITVGKGRMDELDITREIGEAMVYSTPCSMGQNSSLMAMSAIEVFASEYEEHIKKKKCPAQVCTAFQKVYVDPTTCTGCQKCSSVCTTKAIDGANGYIHIVFNNWCTRCGDCISACPEGAIHKTVDRVPSLPDRMMRVGRFRV